MNIKELTNRNFSSKEPKMQKAFYQFNGLLEALKKKELPNYIIEYINQLIEELNASVLEGKQFAKLVKKKTTSITKKLEKELKIG